MDARCLKTDGKQEVDVSCKFSCDKSRHANSRQTVHALWGKKRQEPEEEEEEKGPPAPAGFNLRNLFGAPLTVPARGASRIAS